MPQWLEHWLNDPAATGLQPLPASSCVRRLLPVTRDGAFG